jgi:hypothetical protein
MRFRMSPASMRFRMSMDTERRAAVFGLSVAALGVAASSTDPAQAAVHDNGSGTLSELKARLAKIPRRRDFRTVPMILDKPDL